ncbi:MAG: hypothetical protein IJ270_00760 [Paludibacteraceae bacterium]|nr:hypothetical protein [Paludibacteraceae bacterium]
MYTYEDYIGELVKKYSIIFEESDYEEVSQLFEIISDENDLVAEQIDDILSLIKARLYDNGIVDEYGVREIN